VLGVAVPKVIVVDDGSRDRTVKIVSTYSNVRLICHQKNRGYGSSADYIVSAAEMEVQVIVILRRRVR
jgi:glycosyltransferase involved in cell wall biosynthesis